LKIVYIADCEMPSLRANSINVINTCNALANLNHTVLLYIPNYRKTKVAQHDIVRFYGTGTSIHIKQINANVPFGKYIFYSLSSVYHSIRTPHDVIVGRNILALLLSGLFRMRSILDLHSKLWDRSAIWKTICYMTFSSRHLVGISFNSNRLKDGFIAKYSPTRKLKLVVAPNGANSPEDSLLFEPIHEKIRVGYFGSSGIGRGLPILVKLAEYFAGLDFYLFGEIDYHSSLPNNIKLMGKINPSDVGYERAMCNVLIAPYERNVIMKSGDNTAEYMSPIKLFEYMASKRAILTSDLPAIREVLGQDDAIFANPDKIEEWIEGLNKLANEQARHQYAINSHKRFLTDYTWNKRAEKISSIFNNS
jgi:glycosyltransferase involved in cell wall biosynthesis